MKKADRNDPCPCGSGRKYKKCCLAADEQRQTAGAVRFIKPPAAFEPALSDLDDLSNSVIDLIKAGDLAAAEAVCRRLQQDYPDQVDGIWRLAMVEEARGSLAAAAQGYRDAAAFMRSHEGYDEEGITDMIQSAERMEG